MWTTTSPHAAANDSVETTPRLAASSNTGGGRQRVLPAVGEGEGQWDGGSGDRADRRRTRAGQEGLDSGAAAQGIEMAGTKPDECE